jgi:phosphoglycerate kinase
MRLPDIRDADVAGKTVLVRADINVPMAHGAVTDRARIVRFAPTVVDLVARGASVVIMSHLGRPEGVANPVLSLAPLVPALSEEIGLPVRFVNECVGDAAERVTRSMPEGSVVLLENLRFHPGEEAGDRSFALLLSVLGDIYVNDAFSCSHRAHASTATIVPIMPSYAGPSLVAEVDALTKVLDRPARPSMALVGGAKVSTKIDILRHLIGKVDLLVIGGGMANTFLAARHHEVGRSLYEPAALATATRILRAAERAGCKIILPTDVVVAGEFSATARHEVVPADAIPAEMMAVDVGPRTIRAIEAALEDSRTLLWNGPLGAFELTPFATGTVAVARRAAELTRAGTLTSVAGGGDTAAALAAAGVADQFTYLSTAGGAFLEWIEGRSLPGVAALINQIEVLEES